MTKELEVELQELNELLDEQISNDPKEECFDWDSWISDAPSQDFEGDSMSLIDYEEEDMCWEDDPDEIEWRAFIEQQNLEQQFTVTHQGLTFDEYWDQCHIMYLKYGIQSQYNPEGREYTEDGCVFHRDTDIEKAYREYRLKDIIKEGVVYKDLTLDILCKFCKVYAFPEEALTLIEYYNSIK